MLFLVVCVIDEGVYEDDFRVVEAPSRLAVAQHIVDEPASGAGFCMTPNYMTRSFAATGPTMPTHAR